VILMPMLCLNDMRRLLPILTLAIAFIAMAVPGIAGAKSSHGKSHHKARVADRNHNGMSDRWERKFKVHKATADPDRDGVQNIGEFHNGTNPRDSDSDNDGVNDGNDDANHDGIDDGNEQAGTIQSFDGTKLTVKLVNGDVLSGTVDDQTEIECDDNTSPPDPGTTIPTARKTRHGGDDDPSDDDHPTSTPPADPTTNPGTQPPSQDDDGDEPDDDNNDGEHGNDHSSCGKEALTPGTIVREAELSLTSNGAVFHKIELGGKAPA
jgi:hypothetical protein